MTNLIHFALKRGVQIENVNLSKNYNPRCFLKFFLNKRPYVIKQNFISLCNKIKEKIVLL